jgi:hypothetical protein
MQPVGQRLLAALTGVWGPRVMWLVVGAGGAWSIGQALGDEPPAMRTGIVAWLAWGLGVVALAVPSSIGLTALRMLSVLSVAASIVSWTGGASAVAGGAFVSAALVCGLLAFGAAFGQRCVQASAYGDEQRFLLRAPAPFLVPVAAAGAIWAAAMLAAPLLLGSQRWVVGGLIGALAVALTFLLFPRFHVLTQRWLVLVPAGVVVHDHVVLAETLMVPRANIAAIELALADTEAADFTGLAAGHAVEVSMHSMLTALLPPSNDKPSGTALHVQSFIVAPTRPGAVLRALTAVRTR